MQALFSVGVYNNDVLHTDDEPLQNILAVLKSENIEFEIKDSMPGWIRLDKHWIDFKCNAILEEIESILSGSDYSTTKYHNPTKNLAVPMPTNERLRKYMCELIKRSYYEIQVSVYNSSGELVPFSQEVIDNVESFI